VTVQIMSVTDRRTDRTSQKCRSIQCIGIATRAKIVEYSLIKEY